MLSSFSVFLCKLRKFPEISAPQFEHLNCPRYTMDTIVQFNGNKSVLINTVRAVELLY